MTVEWLSDESSPPQLKGGLELTGSGRANPGLALQVAESDAEQPGRPADHIEHITSQAQRPARAKHQGEQLIVVELGSPEEAQTFPRPLMQRSLGKQRARRGIGQARVQLQIRGIERIRHQAFLLR